MENKLEQLIKSLDQAILDAQALLTELEEDYPLVTQSLNTNSHLSY